MDTHHLYPKLNHIAVLPTIPLESRAAASSGLPTLAIRTRDSGRPGQNPAVSFLHALIERSCMRSSRGQTRHG